jgi:hypothetical protein
MDSPLHGGGRAFESSRLHSGNHYRLAVSPFYVQLDWWWQLKKKQAFSVRLCGFESGYADKHRAREKRSGTSMAIRLNQEAVEHAQNLIKGRPYERNSDLSEAQASADETEGDSETLSQP